MGAWHGTEGALDWIREVIVKGLNNISVANGELSSSDLEWRSQLSQLKEDSETIEEEEEASDEDDDDENSNSNSDDESIVDVAMFAGMFETAMEMLEESGKLELRRHAKE